MRAAVYVRVSTEEQIEGTSLDTQRERCRAQASANGWEVVAEFADEGRSGAKVGADRPELERLMAACRRREVDAVIVAKLDRFGRSNRHLAVALGELDDLGVAFASVNERIDSSTPSGRFLRTLLSGAAEFERDMILERTAAGLRARARAGDWPGGPAPYGFALSEAARGERRRLIAHEPEASVIRRAASLILDEAHTTWTAAKVLNGLGLTPRKADRWAHNRLRVVLLSPTIGGRFVYRSSEGDIEIPVPALLEPDRHRALIDALRSSGTGSPDRGNRFYLLSRGRLFGICGAPMHGVWRRERDSRAYRCASARPDAHPRCSDHPVNADLVEEVAWTEVAALLSHPERMISMAENYLGLRDAETDTQLDHLATIDAKLKRIDAGRTDHVAQALKAGVQADVLRAALAGLDDEHRTLAAHRDRLVQWHDESTAKADRIDRLGVLAATARDRLDTMTPTERRQVLDLLDVRVTVTGWETCGRCEGNGKLKGGRGGSPCPLCRAARRIPTLTLEGVVLDGLDLDAPGSPGRLARHAGGGAGIPFRLRQVSGL